MSTLEQARQAQGLLNVPLIITMLVVGIGFLWWIDRRRPDKLRLMSWVLGLAGCFCLLVPYFLNLVVPVSRSLGGTIASLALGLGGAGGVGLWFGKLFGLGR